MDAEGITQVAPDGFEQAKIGKLISNLVLGKASNADRECLLSIINSFESKGIRDVILACTDLQPASRAPEGEGLRYDEDFCGCCNRRDTAPRISLPFANTGQAFCLNFSQKFRGKLPLVPEKDYMLVTAKYMPEVMGNAESRH